MWNSAAPRVPVYDQHVFGRQTPYVAALLLVAFAFGVTVALQEVYALRPPLFLFFAAVAAAAWLGGRGPGLVALAAAVPLALHFYVVARPDHHLHDRDVLLFVFFATCAFAGDALYSRRRRSEEALRQAHGQLQARALDLQRANDALVAEMAERRRTEAALEHSRSELARATRLASMAEMAASIAHEINQPLTAVVTNAETCVRWLEASNPNLDEAGQAARRAVREAERSSQVVARIRALAKNAVMETSPIVLRSLVGEVLSLLQSDVAAYGVAVHVDVDPALPPLLGDRVQWQQVFVNLITNAIDALKQVTVRPRALWITAHVGQGDDLHIVFRDSGQGIADGVLGRVFEPFVTAKAGGMGVGLAICRSIVEAHGGAIAAAPADPNGACFTIILPLNGSKHD